MQKTDLEYVLYIQNRIILKINFRHKTLASVSCTYIFTICLEH